VVDRETSAEPTTPQDVAAESPVTAVADTPKPARNPARSTAAVKQAFETALAEFVQADKPFKRSHVLKAAGLSASFYYTYPLLGAKAQQESAYRWLEAWVWGELVTPEQASLPESEVAAPAFTVEAIRPAPELLQSTNQIQDYVSSLNQYAQQLGVPLPEYSFKSAVKVEGFFYCACEFLELIGQGDGGSKKQAKSNAAQRVWEQVTRGAASPHAIREHSGK
jgi:Double-stranded RNA binding motif